MLSPFFLSSGCSAPIPTASTSAPLSLPLELGPRRRHQFFSELGRDRLETDRTRMHRFFIPPLEAARNLLKPLGILAKGKLHAQTAEHQAQLHRPRLNSLLE
jgi:hypothetical protein